MRQARALLIGATLLWGLSFPLMRSLELAQKEYAPDIPDSVLASADMAVRFGLAALVLFLIYARQLGRVTVREWSQSAGLATFAGFGLYLQTLGLAWTDASVAAFLTQLYTLIVPLIVALRDRRAPSLRVVGACVLVLVGAAMLSPGLMQHLQLGSGEIIIVISTVFLASQIVWVERPIYAENRGGPVTFLMFALLSVAFAAVFFLSGGTVGQAHALMGQPVLWELTLALIFFCTVFNFLIMNAWQRWVSATEAGLIYCLEPVIATVFSSFLPGWISSHAGISYPNESITWALFAGGGLILFATMLVATEKPRTVD